MAKILDSSLDASLAKQLIFRATEVLDHAYAPYSKFKVGCAILTDSGHIYTGCNIENASFGLTICAERVAVFSAIAQEGPLVRLTAVAITSDPEATTPPCGACRQVLSEFGDDSLIVFFPKDGIFTPMPLSHLLPEKFVLLS